MRKTITNTVSDFTKKLHGKGPGAALARGAGEAMLVRSSGIGIAFGLSILLSRALGAEGYGMYIYAVTCLNMLLLLAKMGFDSVVVKYVSAYNAAHNWAALFGILRRSRQFTFLASTLILFLFCLAALIFRDRFDEKLFYTFLIGSVVLLVEPFVAICQAGLRCLGHIALATLPLTVLRPLLIAAGVVTGVLLMPKQVSSQTVIAAYVVSTVLALIIITHFLGLKLPEAVRFQREPQYHNREWIRMALPMLLSSGALLLIGRTDVLMIGLFMNTTDAGVYNIAVRVVTLISLGLNSVNAIAGPLISRSYSTGKHDELRKVARLSAWGIFAFSLPVAVLFLLFGKLLLSFFGAAFVSGYPALVVLAIGHLVNAMTGSVGLLMIMTAYHKEALYVNVFAAALNILLNLLLIPQFGIVGAAAASSTTLVVCNTCRMFFVYRRLHVNTTIFQFSRV